MNISLISGRHLTATNKRHIAQIITEDKLVGSLEDFTWGTKTIRYAVMKTDVSNEYVVSICKTESNDWGKKVHRKMTCVVAVK